MATEDIRRRKAALKAQAEALQRELELSQVEQLDSFFDALKSRVEQYERDKAELDSQTLTPQEFYDEQCTVLQALAADVDESIRSTANFLVTDLRTPISRVAALLGVGKTSVWRWTQ